MYYYLLCTGLRGPESHGVNGWMRCPSHASAASLQAADLLNSGQGDLPTFGVWF